MANDVNPKQQFKYERYLLKDESGAILFNSDEKDEVIQKLTELSTGNTKITCEKIYPDYKSYQIVHEEVNLI